MRPHCQARVVVSALLGVAGVSILAACATAPRSQPYRTFFLPPAPAPATPPADETVLPEPPEIELYANAVPSLPLALPPMARPAEVEFVLRQSENYFANGKRAFLDGRFADARRDFDRSVQALLAAPENLPGRNRVEARLEELVEIIYKYDLDLVASASEDLAQDKRPLDEILELTFPVDPKLRGQVKKLLEDTGSQLPLEETDAVLSYIQYFTSARGKRTLENGIRRSGRYKSMIERVLEEEGLPQELIFLAQAESGFYPRAISRAKCVGIWQFIQFRGREYGLMQTAATDDRMDPELATRAAARHLHDLFNHFGDWYLAMAAYNCGPGCVDSAIARTGYADFWELRRLGVLPRETANYVPAILAMIIVAKNAAGYGVTVEYDPALEYDSVVLASPMHVALAASALDLPVSTLREINPALNRLVAPAGYAFHVPKGTVPVLEVALAGIPPERRDQWRLHRVEYGDTLASLAKRYGTSAAAVASANGGELPLAGSLAAIPVGYPGDPVKKTVAKAPAKKGNASAASRRSPTAGKSQAKAKTAPRPAKASAKKPQAPVARRTSKGSRRPSGA